MSASLDILYSSDIAPSTENFFGYAFQGRDLVIDAAGYDDFIAAGHEFIPDSDGCYLHVKPLSRREYLFQTDFHGYFPLFYYRHGKQWLVSPSFEVLAMAAKRRGLPLTLRHHQLQAWRSPLSLLQMPTSPRTPFDEICLLSYDEDIVAGPAGLSLRARNRVAPAGGYGAALSEMISNWGDRILTIVDGGMAICADLSGGVDSRAVFSVLYRTLHQSGRLDLLDGGRVFVNSSPRMVEDFEIAKSIAAKMGFPLNHPKRPRYVLAADADSFPTWKQYNLARYSPHLLPIATQDSQIMTFNGVGGEEHRPFYDDTGFGGFDEYLARYRNAFDDQRSFELWLADLQADIASPQPPHDQHINPAIRHYRRHRGRHHTAKQPVNELMAVILGSRAAYDCASFLDAAAVSANQLLFDVMFNCHDALPRMPYDAAEKSPSETNIANLTRVGALPTPVAGRLWSRRVAPSPPAEGATFKGRNLPMREAVEAALAQPEIGALLGPRLTRDARAQLDRMGSGNNLHHHGHLLHYVLLVDVVNRYRDSALNPRAAPPVRQSYAARLLRRGLRIAARAGTALQARR